MFLFNKTRNSIQKYKTGNSVFIEWKTFLNTSPVFGAESTAVFDKNNNLYFGSHSGNFYSITSNGSIRWMFSTQRKIYSSPLIIGDLVFFTSGDGFLYCLDTSGNLIWKSDLSDSFGNKKTLDKFILYLLHLPFTLDIRKRKNIIYRSWASPNSFNKYIIVTGYGKGIQCYTIDGLLKWEYDLGFPRYQLSGVVLDHLNNIYVAARNGKVFKFSKEGKLIWKRLVKNFWEPWGNPVIDTNKNILYTFYSFKERYALITAHSLNGELIWKLKRNAAIRGSCAINIDSNILLCDLNGYIFEVNSTTGNVIREKKITDAKRGLWTTPTLDLNGNILLTTKDGPNNGRLIKLNKDFNEIWSIDTGKSLSVPVIDEGGRVYVGSWDGHYYCYKTY